MCFIKLHAAFYKAFECQLLIKLTSSCKSPFEQLNRAIKAVCEARTVRFLVSEGKNGLDELRNELAN